MVTVAAGLAAIWWGANELKNAERGFQDRLVFSLGALGGAGLTTTLLGGVIGVGWPGFGFAQLAVALIFALSIGAAFGLARVPSDRLLPTGPVAGAAAGGVTVVLLAGMALSAKAYRSCSRLIGCDPLEPAFSPGDVLPLAGVAPYLLLVRFRRHENQRAAYHDETRSGALAEG